MKRKSPETSSMACSPTIPTSLITSPTNGHRESSKELGTISTKLCSPCSSTMHSFKKSLIKRLPLSRHVKQNWKSDTGTCTRRWKSGLSNTATSSPSTLISHSRFSSVRLLLPNPNKTCLRAILSHLAIRLNKRMPMPSKKATNKTAQCCQNRNS